MTAVQSQITHYPKETVCQMLSISEPTLRRWSAKLRQKLKSEFDYLPYEPGVSCEAIRALGKYKKLKAEMGSDKALETIRIEGF